MCCEQSAVDDIWTSITCRVDRDTVVELGSDEQKDEIVFRNVATHIQFLKLKKAPKKFESVLACDLEDANFHRESDDIRSFIYIPGLKMFIQILPLMMKIPRKRRVLMIQH